MPPSPGESYVVSSHRAATAGRTQYQSYLASTQFWDKVGVSGAILVKQVIAIVKPYLVEKVLEALQLAPIEACGVREVKGYGRQKSYLDEYRGSEYSLAFLPKVEITLWVDDLRVEEVVRAVVEVARTGRMGDGKIFILPANEIPGEQTIEF